MDETAFGNIHIHGTDEPPPAEGERFDALAVFPGARIERILSAVTHRPGEWYEQAHDEWVVVLSGMAALRIGDPGRVTTLGPGDWVMLPAGLRHRVERIGRPTLWLAVHGMKR